MSVYTEVSDVDIEEFLKQYAIGSLCSLKGITEGIENTNYLLQTDQDLFILTLYEKRVKSEELPYFLNLMTHLKTKGFICPQPVKGIDGEALRDLCGKKACITTFLKGMSAKKITPDKCGSLGQVMAGFHIASQDYEGYRKNDLSIDGWQILLDKIGKQANDIVPDLYEEMQQDLNQIKHHFPNNLPSGIIHADLFPDNVFFLDKNVSGVIDFYFACNDAFAYEIAICLNAWCFEPDVWEFNTTKARRLLFSYDTVRPLSLEEKESLPIFAHASALRFLLTRTYDWLNQVKGANVKPKNPIEYLRKLRFHRGVKSYREFGL